MCKKNWSLVFMLSVHVPVFSKGKSPSLFLLQWIGLIFWKIVMLHVNFHWFFLVEFECLFCIDTCLTTSGHQIIKGIKGCYGWMWKQIWIGSFIHVYILSYIEFSYFMILKKLELIFLLSKTLNYMLALLYSAILKPCYKSRVLLAVEFVIFYSVLCIINFVNDNGKSYFTLPSLSLSSIIHDYCLQDIWFFIPSNINAFKFKICTSTKW